MVSSELIEAVREEFGVVRSLAPRDVEDLASGGVELRAGAGELLFQSGDDCEGFGLMVDGCIKVSLTSAEGRELVLYRVQPGQTCTVTASCLVSKRTYPADGFIEEPIRALAVPRSLFNALLDRSPAFRDFVLKVLGERITELMELVSEVSFNKLDERLAARLLQLGPAITMSHQQLADELGTSREMVSRLLESFADQRLVSLGRKRVEVLDAALLHTTYAAR